MIYQFQADGWDAPIAVAVTFSPAGVSAVSPEGFEFTGSREQWERFVAMGWAKPYNAQCPLEKAEAMHIPTAEETAKAVRLADAFGIGRKAARDAEKRRAALDELARVDQALGLYEPGPNPLVKG